MYLLLEQHSAPSDDSDQALGFLGMLLESSAFSALLGTVIGFVLSYFVSKRQRREDWERTRKLKQHESLLEFLREEEEQFLKFKTLHHDISGGRQMASLQLRQIYSLIRAKQDYLHDLETLCLKYKPIFSDDESDKSLTELYRLSKAKRKKIKETFAHEYKAANAAGTLSSGTTGMDDLADRDSYVDEVRETLDKFIQQTVKKIGTVFK